MCGKAGWQLRFSFSFYAKGAKVSRELVDREGTAAPVPTSISLSGSDAARSAPVAACVVGWVLYSLLATAASCASPSRQIKLLRCVDTGCCCCVEEDDASDPGVDFPRRHSSHPKPQQHRQHSSTTSASSSSGHTTTNTIAHHGKAVEVEVAADGRWSVLPGVGDLVVVVVDFTVGAAALLASTAFGVVALSLSITVEGPSYGEEAEEEREEWLGRV